jgi:hypothetical protein
MRNSHKPTDEITVGFKAEAQHAEWVHRAAAKAGMTAAAYQKKVMLEWAAADLGIPSAEVAAALAPRPPSSRLVAEAAKAAGMTTTQLTRQAVHELARSILAQAQAKGTPVVVQPRRASGTQLRKVGS